MRYQVPQFIEVEDKIFGPLTLKQFVYLAGGGGLCLAFFTLLPFYIFVTLAIPVMALSLALAFYRVNDRPFLTSIEHAFGFYTNSKLYLWKQRPPELVQKQAAIQPITPAMVPKLSESRLKDLAWSLNIKQTNE
ncbi:hypothetical protein A2419_03140 [Candidatus Adlerbacteria bacterium RIFOXYC1_FULL_48_26]|uniref:PrgI family protein n=1 Tax=Candidatus Adlerbacteria bacterium RIFOXYC1_FULL_48_26 TaxID=1797247 RepID=A0A1F4Y466_9BACT|nr:MAG: hypothetical protein A2419_03140 [Candidatus Adlerbacteria bacterium RIFOXYC1_FULL_48_26]OGC94508.1 MAG: hypothetical protein A2389_01300 [Candidatus Adlerbacteria bacterium RIFOXYB1_FULL_48_10]OGC95153.1 MAG: hypothetical protein A2590_01915 [Candidatus Adlerbacteria bacterium RIFOXYD1_FULL_48_8]